MHLILEGAPSLIANASNCTDSMENYSDSKYPVLYRGQDQDRTPRSSATRYSSGVLRTGVGLIAAMTLAACWSPSPGAPGSETGMSESTESEATESGEATESAGSEETGDDQPSLFGAFEEEGFVTQLGHASAFMVEDCEFIDDCYGNNPSSPYLLFSLPGHPDEPENIPASAIGDLPQVPEGMSPAYALEAKEVMVIVGQTPPSAKYFGFTPYLFTRADSGGDLVTIFASLGDTLNHVNLLADGASFFDTQFAIVASSDADAAESARLALESDGVPASAINLMVLPRDLIDFGLGPVDDTVMMLGRVALFEDAQAGAAYLDLPPLDVYRLTPDAMGEALPTPERLPRGDGKDEDALEPALEELEAAIELSLEGQNIEEVTITSSGAVSLFLNPERCLDMVTECLGDNGDTTYAVGPITVAQGDDTLLLGPDDHFVIYGVNHAAAGKAEYSSLAVYAKTKRMGVVTANDAEMLGSVEAYVPGHPDADMLFAYEVRRDCEGRDYCLDLPTEFPGVGLTESLFFVFRAYVNPGMSVSPDFNELLAERVIVVRAG